MKRRCMEPGCMKPAEIHLKGLTGREWLCERHAQDQVNRAQTVVNAEEELNEHRRSGGKVS